MVLAKSNNSTKAERKEGEEGGGGRKRERNYVIQRDDSVEPNEFQRTRDESRVTGASDVIDAELQENGGTK